VIRLNKNANIPYSVSDTFGNYAYHTPVTGTKSIGQVQEYLQGHFEKIDNVEEGLYRCGVSGHGLRTKETTRRTQIPGRRSWIRSPRSHWSRASQSLNRRALGLLDASYRPGHRSHRERCRRGSGSGGVVLETLSDVRLVEVLSHRLEDVSELVEIRGVIPSIGYGEIKILVGFDV
jgi:hypothetical protein